MGSADSNNAPKAANDQSEADFLRMFGETSPSRLDRQKKIAAALNLDEQKDDLDEINEEDFAKQTEIKVAVDQTPCRPTDAFIGNTSFKYRLEKHVLQGEKAEVARNKNNMKRLEMEKAEALAGKRSWKCIACTFENFKMDYLVCEMCRQ